MTTARDMVADMYPQDIRDGLILAGKTGNHNAINRITDTLVSAGLVRPRSDFSLFPPVAPRNPHPGAEE